MSQSRYSVARLTRTMNDLGGQDRSCKEDDEDAASSSFSTANMKVCRELSEEKRLEIRKTQRILRKEIPKIAIDEAIKRNNAIFEENLRFGFIREAVLDADNLQEIAKQASTRMGNPMEVSPSYGIMLCLLCFAICFENSELTLYIHFTLSGSSL